MTVSEREATYVREYAMTSNRRSYPSMRARTRSKRNFSRPSARERTQAAAIGTSCIPNPKRRPTAHQSDLPEQLLNLINLDEIDRRREREIATTSGHYEVSFGEDVIRTTLADSGDTVDSLLDEIYRVHRRRLHRLVVGLDVEWRPSYYGYSTPPVALLQICVGRRCLVFQILHADYIPDSLFDFFADERFTFVGVGVHDDVAKLWAGYGLEVGCAEDLRSLAAEELENHVLRSAGLQKLVWEVIGVQMQKPHHVRVSQWDARYLSYEQLKYACVDAFASFEVDRRLYDGDY